MSLVSEVVSKPPVVMKIAGGVLSRLILISFDALRLFSLPSIAVTVIWMFPVDVAIASVRGTKK